MFFIKIYFGLGNLTKGRRSILWRTELPKQSTRGPQDNDKDLLSKRTKQKLIICRIKVIQFYLFNLNIKKCKTYK